MLIDAKLPVPAVHASRRGGILALCMLCLLSVLAGCASLSNPANEGIPVRRLPPEYFAVPKVDQRTIQLQLLRQKPPEQHHVDAGDVLGIFIENVLGEKKPDVHLPDQFNPIPAVGLPVAVDPDGTIALPLIPPLKVKDMTIPEVRAIIIKTYLDKDIIARDKKTGAPAVQILVSLMRARHIRVQVFRQEQTPPLATGQITGNSQKGTGKIIELRAYENDVLHALADTGGLPSLDAINEVWIQRGNIPENPKDKGLQTIRIPIRLRPGDPIPFRPEDVILQKGDIVFIESRDTEVYYAGGLLFPRQFRLPRDYDLTVLGACAVAGGPLDNGGVSQNNITGTVLATGIGAPNPSRVTVLRRTKDGGQIPIKVDLNLAHRDRREDLILQPNDILVMQLTVGEALSSYSASFFHASISQLRNLTPTVIFSGSGSGP